MKGVAGKFYFIYAARYVVYLFLGMQMRIFSIVFMVELLLHHVDIATFTIWFYWYDKIIISTDKENWLSVTFEVKAIGHKII